MLANTMPSPALARVATRTSIVIYADSVWFGIGGQWYVVPAWED